MVIEASKMQGGKEEQTASRCRRDGATIRSMPIERDKTSENPYEAPKKSSGGFKKRLPTGPREILVLAILLLMLVTCPCWGLLLFPPRWQD